MHGRPRKPPGYVEDPERAALKEKKLEQYKQLTNWVYTKVQNSDLDDAFLSKSAQLLKINPDVYTVWNYRRRALQPILEGGDRDGASKAATTELRVTEDALHENPKSYSAWHHRMWIMQTGFSSLSEEISQVNKFLKLDSRNFVAWHYRRNITKMAGTDLQEELKYSQALIDSNFSNYSAWHARSAILKAQQSSEQIVSLEDLVAGKSTGQHAPLSPERLAGEFDLVQQAFFTDPEDQSAYIYHRWLLNESVDYCKQAKGSQRQDASKQVLKETLLREEQRCRELIDIEPERSRLKWPFLTLCLLLKLQRAVKDFDPTQELEALYSELAEIDPLRKGFYRDALKLEAL